MRRVQPHPDHLTPADRPRWRSNRERLTGEIDAEVEKALKQVCPTCQAVPGQGCVSLDGTPHATRLGR